MTNEELYGLIQNLNQTQREKLEEYLKYQTYKDTDDLEIASVKGKAYDLYRNDISKLIAKIEVYAHELPIPIYGMVERIVHIHALAIQITEKEEAIRGYEQIILYEKFLINILYLTLTKLYISQSRKYIRVLRTFNHKGVYVDSEPVLRVARKQAKEAIVSLRKGKRELQKIYSIGWIQIEMFLDHLPRVMRRFVNRDVAVTTSGSRIIAELEEAWHLAESVVNLCEENYAEVVDNGYISTWRMRFVYALPGWISFLLALYGTVSIYYKLAGK